MSAEYFAVEYCLQSGLVISGSTQPLGHHENDTSAVLSAASTLGAEILNNNYIGHENRRWMVFNNNEYTKLLIEIGSTQNAE